MEKSETTTIMELQFALSGPIRTGILVDTRRLIGSGSEEVLAQLRGSLTSFRVKWLVYSDDANTLEINVTTRRERIVKPAFLALASFRMDELARLEHSLRATEMDVAGFYPPKSLSLVSVHMRFFSFGYATFRAEFRLLGSNEEVSLRGIREGVEALSAERSMGHFKTLFENTIGEFRLAAAPIRVSDGELIVRKGTISSPMPRWVHRVYGLRLRDQAAVQALCNRKEELIYTSSEAELEDLYPRSGTSVYVSSGNSALFSADAGADSAWRNLNEMVEFQNAFFAKAEDLDESLMLLVNRISLDKERARIDRKLMKEMDSYAIHIVDSREEVLIFTNDVDDYEGHLDPDAKRIWTGLWGQWETGRKFRQIEKQVDIMSSLYERIVVLLNQDQSRRLSSFALAFTLIAGFSAFVDILGFTQGSSWSMSSVDWENTAVAVVLVSVLAIGFWRITKR